MVYELYSQKHEQSRKINRGFLKDHSFAWTEDFRPWVIDLTNANQSCELQIKNNPCDN